MKLLLVVTGLMLLATVLGAALQETRGATTVIYEGTAAEVRTGPSTGKDLWLTLQDLERVAGFELKPEGICRDELCFPIPVGREKEFLDAPAGPKWFNMSAFARLLSQPVSRDEKNDVWLFGEWPEAQNRHIESLEAPDFSLPDWKGRGRSLSEFRGKKVLLITWASW